MQWHNYNFHNNFKWTRDASIFFFIFWDALVALFIVQDRVPNQDSRQNKAKNLGNKILFKFFYFEIMVFYLSFPSEFFLKKIVGLFFFFVINFFLRLFLSLCQIYLFFHNFVFATSI